MSYYNMITNLTTSVPRLNIRMNFRSPEFVPLIQFSYAKKDRQDRINCRGIKRYGGLPGFI